MSKRTNPPAPTITLQVTLPAAMLEAYRRAGMVPNGAVNALARAMDRHGSPLPSLELAQLKLIEE